VTSNRTAVGRPRVVIVGAGPHGLTAAMYLIEAGMRAGDLTIVDPSGEWMATWRSCFTQLGIAHLRSPAVHHPHPHPYALIDFASAGSRRSELVDRYGLPTTSLFHDFCTSLVTESGLADRVIADRVIGLHDDGLIELSSGSVLPADHIVWASNPSVANVVDEAAIPSGAHVTEWDHVVGSIDGGSVAVVGGGLTAAHLVDRALRGGTHVEWVTRRPVQVRDFDTDPGWLGPKEMSAFVSLTDMRARRRAVVEARDGGSVPAWMMRRLAAHERKGRLCRRLGAIPRHVDAVWLALGTKPTVAADPALARWCAAHGIDTIDDIPVIDETLMLGARVQVLGRLAQLQLGPTAGNLAGARRGAEAVVSAVLGSDRLAMLVG
jgi:hypothetical protein